jgi:glycyl-tRNA synthetase beta chain
MKQDLLFEIGCEEIPAKLLGRLAQELLNLFTAELAATGISFEASHSFATPRRLAFILRNVIPEQPEQKIERRGPAVIAAFNDKKEPTPALLGFLKSCDVTLEQTETEKTSKGEWIVYRGTVPGKQTIEILPSLIQMAFKKLAIPKPMRWGNHAETFIRPVHWLVCLLGNQIVPLTLFGLQANRMSYGHRFMAPQAIELQEVSEYETKLEASFVIVDFEKRKNKILSGIQKLAAEKQGTVFAPDNLVNEVSGLVEWPVPLLAHFEEAFLAVPKEALMASMMGHQKCFPILDAQDNIKPYFITVSNLESKEPTNVIQGNEKVMRARLSDAKFFYEEDLKHNFNVNEPYYATQLKNLTWQKGLGSVYDKSQRLGELASFIFRHSKGHSGAALPFVQQAGQLCKLDLVSNMVSEFPELQGIMGSYYVKGNPEVAQAIANHYKPRFSGDSAVMNAISASVALADKIDTLVGMFGMNHIPTGEKDPFGLRRSALGLVRIILENQLSFVDEKSFLIDLNTLLLESKKIFAAQQIIFQNNNIESDLMTFIFDRLHSYYKEQNKNPKLLEAVLAVQDKNIEDFAYRMEALEAFLKTPEADALIEANKRVKNILKEFTPTNIVKKEVLLESAEKDLYQIIEEVLPSLGDVHQGVIPHNSVEYYTHLLQKLSQLKPPLDVFFDKSTGVMVMDKNIELQNNRLTLLWQTRQLFLKVADFSLL